MMQILVKSDDVRSGRKAKACRSRSQWVKSVVQQQGKENGTNLFFRTSYVLLLSITPSSKALHKLCLEQMSVQSAMAGIN